MELKADENIADYCFALWLLIITNDNDRNKLSSAHSREVVAIYFSKQLFEAKVRMYLSLLVQLTRPEQTSLLKHEEIKSIRTILINIKYFVGASKGPSSTIQIHVFRA
jgi:hypothetical protein